mgnify:CR=1 FL=1
MSTPSWEYRWPSYIPKDKRRAWISPNAMDDWFKVDSIRPMSYIARAERLGKPIKHRKRTAGGSKLYRVLDLLARARGEGKRVEQADRLHNEQLMGELTLKRYHLEKEIGQLEQNITHFVESSALSNTLTGKHMVSEQAIVSESTSFEDQCGVYFLVKGSRVVYVGQSVHISARLSDHTKNKDFDSYAFIQCPPAKLDVLESLYIHALAPEYQGRSSNKGGYIAAPYSFAQLIAFGDCL